MGKLNKLMVHCTDSPAGRAVSSGEIHQWHRSPLELENGEIKYMRKVYSSRKDLPNEKINGIDIKLLSGRGWSKVGYTAMIHLDGTLEVLVDHNEDNWVDSSEITNGAAGFNGNTRHIVIVGGTGFNMADFDEVLTSQQFVTLQIYIKEFLGKHPECQVLGHYQVNPNKGCPGFNMPKFLKFISIPKKYIYA